MLVIILKLQVVAMIVCLFLEMAIYLLMTPNLLQQYSVKKAFEKAGVCKKKGLQVGRLARAQKHFYRMHIIIVIGNFICLACTIIHAFYLSNKLCKE